MTWKSFHNRSEILRCVIAVANTRRDGMLPMDVDGVPEAFGDPLSVLAALQLKWHTRLAGHIERELLAQPMDLPESVAVAWGNACDELPGVRLVLDHYRAEPIDEATAAAMAKATIKEHSMLAVMSGLASVQGDAVAAPVGARIEERARLLHRGILTLAPASAGTEERPSFLERLRSVLAA